MAAIFVFGIERFRVTSSPFKFTRKTENCCHVGVQGDSSFYGNLGEWKGILVMLLVCVESDKIPLLCKEDENCMLLTKADKVGKSLEATAR